VKESRISEYRDAVEKLRAAIEELKAEAKDWTSAYERVLEAEKRCEQRRIALRCSYRLNSSFWKTRTSALC
jgi:hypothetical protein